MCVCAERYPSLSDKLTTMWLHHSRIGDKGARKRVSSLVVEYRAKEHIKRVIREGLVLGRLSVCLRVPNYSYTPQPFPMSKSNLRIDSHPSGRMSSETNYTSQMIVSLFGSFRVVGIEVFSEHVLR